MLNVMIGYTLVETPHFYITHLIQWLAGWSLPAHIQVEGVMSEVSCSEHRGRERAHGASMPACQCDSQPPFEVLTNLSVVHTKRMSARMSSYCFVFLDCVYSVSNPLSKQLPQEIELARCPKENSAD